MDSKQEGSSYKGTDKKDHQVIETAISNPYMLQWSTKLNIFLEPVEKASHKAVGVQYRGLNDDLYIYKHIHLYVYIYTYPGL